MFSWVAAEAERRKKEEEEQQAAVLFSSISQGKKVFPNVAMIEHNIKIKKHLLA